MATTITPTDVISQFGSYYIDNGQNMSDLLMRPFTAFGSREAFTNVPTEDTQLRWSDVTVGEVLQPYQDTFTEKGAVTFKPVSIDLQQVKIDQSFNPNNLVYSWLGFLTSTKTDRTTWPFVRWFIEVYLMNQVMDDIEKKVIFYGDKVAPTPGTAGAAIEVMDGVKELIKAKITAGSTTAIAVGAPPADAKDFVTYMETIAKSIDEIYWTKNIVFNMSRAHALLFKEGMQAKYNINYAQVAELQTIRNFENFKVAGRDSMRASTNIWGTPIENAVFATKGFGNAQAFEVEKVDRKVKIYTDFHIGLGFLMGDLIFTNGEGL